MGFEPTTTGITIRDSTAELPTPLVRPEGIEPPSGINNYMLKCIHCQTELKGKYTLKFCSRSCSASHNNKTKVKHGKYAEKECAVCKTLTKTATYCSKTCSGLARRKYLTEEEKTDARRRGWREHNANYRAQLLNQTPVDADRNNIRIFYDNCPTGYEVDHIIPISKGGLHTLSNLQYLTVTENRRKSNKLVV